MKKKRHLVQGLATGLLRWRRDSRTETFDADGFVRSYFDREEPALTLINGVSLLPTFVDRRLIALFIWFRATLVC